MPIPVLIDTDIGDDVDDALALALAVRCPEIDLVGVTTVYQCAGLRARMVRRLLSVFGRSDVPVVVGADRPLTGSVRPEWRPNQAEALDPQSGPDEPRGAAAEGARQDSVAGTAAAFIAREGMRRPGLVLVTIGAMTNAALAFALEPRLAGAVRVVAMAGAWDRQGAEYNVACDPEAVAAVLAAGARPEFVGLDVTMRTVMRPGDVRALVEAPDGPHAVLGSCVRAWQRHGGRGPDHPPVLHDPLAVAAVFRPDLLRWREARVAVDLGSAFVRGQTCAVAGAPNARVAHDVDPGFAAWFGGRAVGAGGGART